MEETPRPYYHFTPPHMWLNDPNGLVYYNGEYHLFYQHHPASIVWGPMHWGHAVSRDLINWQHLPIALFPDEQGMIFSGSAVVDKFNTAGFGTEAMVLIFTYNQAAKESQSLAYSIDQGRTWTKYSGNPVIPHPIPMTDCRDPKVFWHDERWVMLLAAGHEILFYVSQDLKKWKLTGSFGGGYGSTDGVWETPELFQLPVDNEAKWVLTVGVGNGSPAGGSGTQYFIGAFDGENFVSENSKATTLWADYGADYYAPQAWNDEPNGRRLMIGWMNNWQYARLVPASTWRGAFTIIREASLTRTEHGVRLVQKAIPEMQKLRGERYHWQEELVQPAKNILADLQGASLEILAEFQVKDDIDRFGLRVRVGSSEQTTISYNPKDRTLLVDRTHSGQVDFNAAFARVHTAQLDPMNDIVRLHIFVDSSSVEVFANDGLLTFSDYIFPAAQSQGVELFAEGGTIMLLSLDIYQLNPATFQHTRN